MVTSYKMAKCPETVVTFLEDLTSKIYHQAEVEKDILLQRKKLTEGTESSELYPWDIPYYIQQVEKDHHGTSLDNLSAYFSIENCIEGLRLLCTSLFGIQLVQVDFDNGESWASDLKKLELREENGDLIGHLYLDLYPRSNKYYNAAHFQICSGRIKPSSWTQKKPVATAALVCNFNVSRSFALGLSDNCLLNHSEVQILFHEFGHALHSLLSRTELQHLSGTRGELDFIETPAQLMEYFTFDEKFLQLFAKHYVTGASIPTDMVKSLNESRNRFQAIHVQQQILYSMFDQAISGPKFDHVAGVSSVASTDLLRHLEYVHRGFDIEQSNFWHARFTHFINYGSSYYSYLYAKAFAADIWHTCFESDPLSRESGQKYRDEILRWGGAKDPIDMLEAMLGRHMQVSSFSN
eukprot:CAMPEP_0184069144 /NCGR_PEP_ID=MMETSP0957-20130417/40021_1 /TAXON_ID=627963 /ORGANISM="Aplanochytrium sp, Strain PBS07" /LENGTH=407 /DNA_ID=CAMNT_0026368437 /DNA_START=209 /DNA_END=1432 /DNA_ORIENTATION=-